ncbi:hypothetical protein CEE45_00385 [Candidatus Heimdallarchaeota archaeon B3_Heim]|nr:MAG: hypothetical protein CEE45_00385 [Candidatus Heimdallarchaeota archaeon B3_Heim]
MKELEKAVARLKLFFDDFTERITSSISDYAEMNIGLLYGIPVQRLPRLSDFLRQKDKATQRYSSIREEFDIIIIYPYPHEYWFRRISRQEVKQLAESFDKIKNYQFKGKLLFIVPQSLLLLKSTEPIRQKINNDYCVNGIVSYPKIEFHKESFINLSIIILSDKGNKTQFSIVSSLNELEISLNSILSDKKIEDPGIFITSRRIKNEIFDPSYYHPTYNRLEEELATYTTIKLGEMANIKFGLFCPKKYLLTDGKYGYVRPRNVHNHKIHNITDYVDLNFTKREKKWFHLDLEKQKLIPGDILIPRGFDFRKIVLINEVDCPAFASNSFYVIKSKKVESRYLYSYLVSNLADKLFFPQLERVAKGFVKQINITDLREILIPIPPFFLQKIESSTALDYNKILELEDNIIFNISKQESEKILRESVIESLENSGWGKDSISIEKSGYDIILNVDEERKLFIEIKINISDLDKIIEQLIPIDKQTVINHGIVTDGLGKIVFVNLTDKSREMLDEWPTKKKLVSMLS